jgi:hypothetical protein
MIETLRSLLPHLSPLAKALGLYVETTTNKTEYVGTLDVSEKDLEHRLVHDYDFERNTLAAYKTVQGTSDKEIGSFRLTHRLSDIEPLSGRTAPERASQYDRDGHKAYQLHVILFEQDDDPETTAVYAHHELAWDVYPIKHYRGSYMADRFGADMARSILRDEPFVEKP